VKAGTGNEEPDGHPDSPSGTSRVVPAPAVRNQPDECHDHGEHPDDCEAGLDAYIARLAAAAPPLSSQQRDTIALLLRRPRRR
jgi:hypothetical protein